MAKTKMLMIRISQEQENILLAKAKSAGFRKKSEYVRYVLFMSLSVEEKINKIFEKVCKDES
jgi:hypothetical protein